MMGAVTSDNANLGMGKVQNNLGWLTTRGGQQGFNPARFIHQTGLKPATVGAAVGQSRTAMYKDFIPLKPTHALRKKIIDLVIAADIAYLLFDRDEKETAQWVVSPNMLLFGETPFEICMRGDGKALIQWLLDRAGHSGVTEHKG